MPEQLIARHLSQASPKAVPKTKVMPVQTPTSPKKKTKPTIEKLIVSTVSSV